MPTTKTSYHEAGRLYARPEAVSSENCGVTVAKCNPASTQAPIMTLSSSPNRGALQEVWLLECFSALQEVRCSLDPSISCEEQVELQYNSYVSAPAKQQIPRREVPSPPSKPQTHTKTGSAQWKFSAVLPDE